MVAIDLRIDNLPQDISDTIKKSLSLTQNKDDPLLNETLIRRLQQRGVEEIRLGLQTVGFYAPVIYPALEQSGEGWIARYRVEAGLPTTLVPLDVRIDGPGGEDDQLRKWLDELPLREGDVLNHQQYEKTKADLIRLARSHGYFDGRFVTSQVKVNQQDHDARIQLHFDSGPRYRFGVISLQQSILTPKLISRFLQFREGDPYDSTELLRLQQTLSDSEYFDNVSIKARVEDAQDQRVPVDVELSPRKPSRYSASLGYGTDTGPRAGLGYERRRVNQRGHRFSMNYSASEILNALTTSYRIPLGKPATDYFALTSDWIEEDTTTASSSRAIYGARLVRLIGEWQRMLALNLQTERYVVGDTSGKSELLIPSLGIQRAVAMPRNNLQLGWHFGLTARGAAQGMFSDTSFSQVLANAKLIQPLGRNDRLIARGNIGASWINTFSELPASQRFFTGGDYSVRGYAYNSLGPKDDSGRVIGGRNLLVGSLELEHAVSPNFAMAAFIDAGNAFDNLEYTLYKGAGMGLRWRIPLGTIGIDVAQAMDKSNRPWRLHLTVGSDL